MLSIIGKSCMFSYLETVNVTSDCQTQRRDRNAQLASKLRGDLGRSVSRRDVERGGGRRTSGSSAPSIGIPTPSSTL